MPFCRCRRFWQGLLCRALGFWGLTLPIKTPDSRLQNLPQTPNPAHSRACTWTSAMSGTWGSSLSNKGICALIILAVILEYAVVALRDLIPIPCLKECQKWARVEGLDRLLWGSSTNPERKDTQSTIPAPQLGTPSFSGTNDVLSVTKRVEFHLALQGCGLQS